MVIKRKKRKKWQCGEKNTNIPDGFQVIPAERLDYRKAEIVTDQEGILVKWDEESKSFVKWFHSDFEDSRDRENADIKRFSKFKEGFDTERQHKIGKSGELIHRPNESTHYIYDQVGWDQATVKITSYEVDISRIIKADEVDDFLDWGIFDDLTKQADLTPKQLKVASLICQGKSFSEIALELGITKSAVQKHVELIRKKFEKNGVRKKVSNHRVGVNHV